MIKGLSSLLPVIKRSAPNIAFALEQRNTDKIMALLGVITNTAPHNEDAIIDRLSRDPDLYMKLNKLEKTHCFWVSS